MRTFTRRMASDRLILFFTFMVFVGIAGIIIYAKANPSQTTFAVPDQIKPPDLGAIVNATGNLVNTTITGLVT